MKSKNKKSSHPERGADYSIHVRTLSGCADIHVFESHREAVRGTRPTRRSWKSMLAWIPAFVRPKHKS